MEMVLRYFVILVITIGLQMLFSVLFHFGMKQIHESHSEESANQSYVFLKYASFILLTGFFVLLLMWDYIGVFFLPWYHKLFISFFFLYFLAYCKLSMGMAEHFINLLYFPKLANGVEYDGLWGEFRVVQQKAVIIHKWAWLYLDISDRI